VTSHSTRILLGLLLLAPLASCVTGNFGRTQRYEVVPEGVASNWVLGATTLTECLDQLGAPIDVWAAPDGQVLMAWYGSDDKGWSVTISVPVGRAADLSASYADMQDGDEGVVLFFDKDFRLVRWVEGKVADLVREKARPLFGD
jgi:hypothetical protein